MNSKNNDSSELLFSLTSNVFLVLSSVISASVTGLFAYIFLAKIWVYFGVLQPRADGLTLGVLVITPIYYKIYRQNLFHTNLKPNVQFKKFIIHLLWVSLTLVLVLNLDLVISFLYNFSRSLIGSLT